MSTTSDGTGYNVLTPTFGTDCLVEVQTLTAGFFVMVKVNLSGGTTTLNLTQPLTTSSATVTGATGDFVQLTLSSPYGMVPVTGFVTLNSSSQAITFSNPYGYSGSWSRYNTAANTPTANNTTTFQISSAFGSITSPFTLPALPSSGPTTTPLASPLSYSGGTLSLAAVTGANLYSFGVTGYGFIYSGSPSVSLPSWMKTILSGQTLTVTVAPSTTNVSFDLSVVGTFTNQNASLPPNIQFATEGPTVGAYQTSILF